MSGLPGQRVGGGLAQPPGGPDLLDLSHLNEFERQQILAVLQRDEEFRTEVDTKVK